MSTEETNSLHKKKVALFCGTFNPIHNGHVAVAKAAVKQGFYRVDFLVALQSPYKSLNIANSYKHRVAMCQLVAKYLNQQHVRNQHLSLSNSISTSVNPNPHNVNCSEEKLPTPSYTAATLKYLTKNTSALYTLLLGEDNFYSLPEWNEGYYILQNFPIVVYPRTSTENKSLLLEKKATQTMPRKARMEHVKKGVQFLTAPYLNFSSTKIRENVANGGNIISSVPTQVADYISKHKLYMQ